MQVTVLGEASSIPGVKPAVFDRLGTGVFLLVVALAHGGAAADDLAVVGDPALAAGQGFTHGVETHVPVAVDVGDADVLGLPVNLFQVDAQAVVEAEHVRAEGRAASVGVSEAQEAQLIQQRAGQAPVRDLAFQRGQATWFLAAEAGVGGVGAPLQKFAVDGPVGAVTFLHADVHLALNAFPDARRGEHEVRPDLDQILHGGLVALGKVDGDAVGEGHADGHHLLADPRHRQETQVIAAGFELLDLTQRFAHVQQVAVAEHGGFGCAGGAGREAEVAYVVRVALGGFDVEDFAGLLPTQAKEFLEGHEPVVVCVFRHAARVFVDDLADFAQFGAVFQQLVHLFLVLRQHHHGVGVVHDVFHFAGDAALVHAHADGAQSLSADFHEHPLGDVFGDHRDLIPAPDTQGVQASGDFTGAFQVGEVGRLVPDAEFLVPQRDTGGRQAGAFREQLRDGEARDIAQQAGVRENLVLNGNGTLGSHTVTTWAGTAPVCSKGSCSATPV